MHIGFIRTYIPCIKKCHLILRWHFVVLLDIPLVERIAALGAELRRILGICRLKATLVAAI